MAVATPVVGRHSVVAPATQFVPGGRFLMGTSEGRVDEQPFVQLGPLEQQGIKCGDERDGTERSHGSRAEHGLGQAQRTFAVLPREL